MKKTISNQRLLLWLFAIEGSFIQFAMTINGFGNNLYATNMGATETQIGLIQTIPNLVAAFLLIPLGILANHLRSSKTIPNFFLLLVGIAYLFFGTVPAMGANRMNWFFIFLAFTVGGIAIYNAQWQSFFGDAVAMEDRNEVLTARNRLMFFVGIIMPVVCGILMGRHATAEGKILVLRIFFYLSGVLVLLQTLVVKRIPVGAGKAESTAGKEPFSLNDLKEAFTVILKNRNLKLFFLPMLFFYMTWQFDWSMWYLGQITYCGLTETSISISNGLFNIGQLIMIGIMAKVVKKKSVDFAVIFAAAGLAGCPLVMLISSILPMGIRPTMFILMFVVINSPQCALNLCQVQMLLQAAPEKNRALIISIFTLLTTITNSFIPLLGVRLYVAMGADLTAFRLYNVIAFGLRLLSILFFLWRYRVLHPAGNRREMSSC